MNDAEKGEDVTTDPITNNVFFTGYTGDNAITFFGSSSYYTQSFGGGTNKVDAYLLCFTSSVVRVWGSYIGYTGHDDGTALIANNWNQLFLAGYTQSSQTGNFLNMNPGGGAWFVNSVNSGYDCHISRFTIDPLNPIGISELDVIDESLTIYPNPSSGEFNYQFTSTDKAVFIKVYNIIGELIYMEKSIINNGIAVGSVNLSSFSNGIYFVTAETAGHRIAKKIIKQ